MPNLLHRGATWLGAQLQTAAGREVTYTRSGGQTFTVTAVPHRVDYEVDDDDGIPRSVTFYDFTFPYADLGFSNDDTPFEVIPGDQLTETLDGMDFTYTVAPPGTRKIMEWMDSAGVLVVVHSKLFKKAPTP